VGGKGGIWTRGFDKGDLRADLLGVERTTLTRNLRPLEAKGWVVGASDRADQRVRRVELTAKGRAAAAKALPAWRRAQAGVGALMERYGVRLSAAGAKS
jgi:DNA-binding MarR family transcriptional regulator